MFLNKANQILKVVKLQCFPFSKTINNKKINNQYQKNQVVLEQNINSNNNNNNLLVDRKLIKVEEIKNRIQKSIANLIFQNKLLNL